MSPRVGAPAEAPGGAGTVVVLRALGLGDLLTAVPALRGLRRRFDDHRIVLVGPAALAALARSSGTVDDVLDAHGLEVPLPRAAHGAEVAVNLHGCGPESSRLLAATVPGTLVAFHHADVAATAGGPPWDGDEHEVRRWCRLVGTAGAPARPDDLVLPPPPGATGHGAVVVHPGAADPARRWPPERWSSVVRVLAADGHRVLITGSADEVLLGAAVQAGSGVAAARCSVVAGTTDVEGLAALVAGARLVVCGDTGVAHLATAYATPSVLLFGPTPPERWGPITGGPHRVLWAGRTGDPHGQRPDPGLLELTVPLVLTAIADALGA